MKQRQESKKIIRSLKNLITNKTPIGHFASDPEKKVKSLLRKLERLKLTDEEFNSLDKELKELSVKKIMEINESKLKQNPQGNKEANEKLLKSAKEGSIVGILHSLMKGADINAKDNKGNTFLHLAVYENKMNIIKFLAENKYLRDKIDWNAKTNRGKTFLHLAAYNNRLSMIQFLAKDEYLRNIINWNAKDNDGWTILHQAASKNHQNIMQFLAKDIYLRNIIDWNAKDNKGNTLFHFTAFYDRLNIIKFFFENKDNFELIKDSVYAVNKYRRTILGIAGDEVEAYLVNIGYNPFIGKVDGLKNYKETYRELLEKIKTIEDAKRIAKENNFNEDIFIMGLPFYFAENCDNNLLNFIS